MMRPVLSFRVWLVLGLVFLALPGLTRAQDRRSRSTPGIVLEPGGRLGSCDALLFSPAGNELLAAGDDKVVRIWRVGKQTLFTTTARVLRWPIYREQRGSIFAMALSPRDGGARIAIGGFGLVTGMLAILDRKSGEILKALEKPTSAAVVTAIAWSPDGKYTVHGTASGELFRWEPMSREKSLTPFAGTPRPGNRVRLIAFVDATRFLVVTQDGKIYRRDLLAPDRAVAPIGTLSSDEVFTAALSPDRHWLAVASQNVGNPDEKATQRVELIDLRKLLKEGKGASGVSRIIRMPERPGYSRFPTALAFDSTSSLLAVGMREARHLAEGLSPFSRATDGLVHVWAIQGSTVKRRTTAGLPIGYDVDAIAFRPPHKDNPGVNQLAVAGGPNHEVRLFNLDKENAALSVVRSPGSCLWSVAMSEDGKYIGWREQLNDNPNSPNDRGKGPWRVFTLEAPRDGKGRRILAKPPAGFRPVAPLHSLGDWRVETTENAFAWYIRGPQGTKVELNEKNELYFRGINQVPQCWTFLPATGKKPARLAIGHMWGVSLYELRPNRVRLVRVMTGHQAQVMSVAPSADGKLLLTTGRDQTIACWSLEDWPSSPEIGARFSDAGGKVRVQRVDPGSPAWEAGLTVGDEIDLVAIAEPTRVTGPLYDGKGLLKYDKVTNIARGTFKQDGEPVGFAFAPKLRCDARQIVSILNDTRANRNHYFAWRADGKDHFELTSVRQRPLWVFFPTRANAGNNWLIWRWRDYYYDSDLQQTDHLAGWQRTRGLSQTPSFYPLSNLAGSLEQARTKEERRYYNPEKIWPYIRLLLQDQDPKKVLFADVEPPEVRMRVVQAPVKDPKNPKNDRDLRLEITVRPRHAHPMQRLTRVTLWLDDYLYEKPPAIDPKTGGIATTLTIPQTSLQRGRNVIRLCCFNAAGGRAEATETVVFEDATRGKPNLLALCVGVGRYPAASGLRPLRCPPEDARALARVFRQHENSKLFSKAMVLPPLLNEKATRSIILDQLRSLGAKAKRDDWLILFLSGHGAGEQVGPREIKAGTFYFICVDTVPGQPQTGLRGRDLAEVLQKIPCNKLILMDACHSGDRIPDPTRSLNRDGAEFLMFTACKHTEVANEPDLDKIKEVAAKDPKKFGYLLKLDLNHGLFTKGLLEAVGHPDQFVKSRGRQYPLSADSMAGTIRSTIADMLEKLREDRDSQSPVFVPNDPGKLRRLVLFCSFTEPGH
jgi:WD40 repeat protein